MLLEVVEREARKMFWCAEFGCFSYFLTQSRDWQLAVISLGCSRRSWQLDFKPSAFTASCSWAELHISAQRRRIFAALPPRGKPDGRSGDLERMSELCLKSSELGK